MENIFSKKSQLYSKLLFGHYDDVIEKTRKSSLTKFSRRAGPSKGRSQNLAERLMSNYLNYIFGG